MGDSTVDAVRDQLVADLKYFLRGRISESTTLCLYGSWTYRNGDENEKEWIDSDIDLYVIDPDPARVELLRRTEGEITAQWHARMATILALNVATRSQFEQGFRDWDPWCVAVVADGIVVMDADAFIGYMRRQAISPGFFTPCSKIGPRMRVSAGECWSVAATHLFEAFSYATRACALESLAHFADSRDRDSVDFDTLVHRAHNSRPSQLPEDTSERKIRDAAIHLRKMLYGMTDDDTQTVLIQYLTGEQQL
jgi:hypothetical protein